MLLPATDEAEGSVPRGRSEAQYQGECEQDDGESVPSTVEYPEHTSADLVIFDDSSWCFLSAITKLASNTSYFSFVVKVDGINDLTDEATSPLALSVLANMVNAEPHEGRSEVSR